METNPEILLANAMELLSRSNFSLSPTEVQAIRINDFGLNNLPTEGFAFVDLLRTERVRTTLMILLPNQALPQHKHPPYDSEPGKEESVRVIWGQFTVCIEGAPTPGVENLIPPGKEPYYTARKAVVLEPCMQFTVPPDTAHWFRAGPEGAVVLACQNRVDEERNLFYDPASNGCPIPPGNVT
jgi:D-lyxose ketol-isomerase